MNNIHGCVYLLTNTVTGKRYVGMTVKDPRQRFREHVAFSKNPAHQYTLAKALRKYGKDAFSVDVLRWAETAASLEAAEREEIARLKPEYNGTTGGEGAYQLVGAARQRLADINAQLRGKAVQCVDTGVVYLSASVAARAFGISRGEAVARVCRGERLSAGGVRFVWAPDGAATGLKNAVPDDHQMIPLVRYSAQHRDYSRYKTPEFAEKVRVAMKRAGRSIPRDVMECVWERRRKAVVSACGLHFPSMTAAAAHFHVDKTTVGRCVRDGRPVPGTGVFLRLEG